MPVVNDTYTGHVDPQTSARRTLPGVTIIKTSVGPMDNNAYLITCTATGHTLLIDAAHEPDVLNPLISEYAPTVSLIVTSHQHADHWQALTAVVEATGAPTAAHRLDAAPLPVTPDRLLADGETLEIGNLIFDVLHLGGHTPGSIALALRSTPQRRSTHIFTGDCLFPGGPGRTTQPDEFLSLMDDLESKIFAHFDDDTVIYPGHGDDTTVGTERPHLGEWRSRGW